MRPLKHMRASHESLSLAFFLESVVIDCAEKWSQGGGQSLVRDETIAFWFLNLEIWLWMRLSFASTRPKRPMGGRPSRILGQGYSRVGTFYCVIYSVINRERTVQSLANNRWKFTNEKFFIREGILRKKCCSFGYCFTDFVDLYFQVCSIAFQHH